MVFSGKEILLKNKLYVYVGIAIFVIVSGVLFLVNQNSVEEAKYYEKEDNKKGQEEIAVREIVSPAVQTGQTGLYSDESVEVGVFVCGQVQEEGVYFLRDGARIKEAIQAAGGFTSEADKDYWNLAAYVYDGQRIYVPLVGENIPNSFEDDSNDKKVNLNTATSEQLISLPGIGSKKAEDILKYRKQIGRFTSTEQLMEISGIKESLFNEIKDLVTVQ